LIDEREKETRRMITKELKDQRKLDEYDSDGMLQFENEEQKSIIDDELIRQYLSTEEKQKGKWGKERCTFVF